MAGLLNVILTLFALPTMNQPEQTCILQVRTIVRCLMGGTRNSFALIGNEAGRHLYSPRQFTVMKKKQRERVQWVLTVF